MSRTPEHDFLRAVGTPLPRKEPKPEQSPAARTPKSLGISQRGSIRRDSRAGLVGPADNGAVPPQPGRRIRRVSLWIVSGGVAALFVLVAALLLHQMSHPHQHSLPDGVSDVPEWWQPASSLPELPEGTTCGAEDQNAELRKLLIHTQQQLKESQDLLRRTDRDARSAAGLKKQMAACEEKLHEAASGQAHQAQELTQKLHQAEQSLRTAHARLKDRDRSSVLLKESAAAAQMRAGSLEEALAKEAAARAESAAAAEAAEKKLGKAQAGWEQERAALAAEAARGAKEGARRVEELEGSLAECRGRVAGLGEGCGRCWQMLDEAQGEGHTAKMQAAGIAAGVCGFVAVAAYVHTLIQKRQISHLKLESEKLRCAVLEAQGGVRQRMSRAGSAARIGQQIPIR